MEIVLGALVSGIVQAIKTKFGTNTTATLFSVTILSLAIAGIYTTLVKIGYWDTLKEIIVWSGAIYTFIIARFEK